MPEETERNRGGTYLPIGIERLWLREAIPTRLVCHARVREVSPDHEPAAGGEFGVGELPEVLMTDLRLYSADGESVGAVSGLTVKRATRAALLSAISGIGELLYETVWRQAPLLKEPRSAAFLRDPVALDFREYLAAESLDAGEIEVFLEDLESLSQVYALACLDELRWKREGRDGRRVECIAAGDSR